MERALGPQLGARAEKEILPTYTSTTLSTLPKVNMVGQRSHLALCDQHIFSPAPSFMDSPLSHPCLCTNVVRRVLSSRSTRGCLLASLAGKHIPVASDCDCSGAGMPRPSNGGGGCDPRHKPLPRGNVLACNVAAPEGTRAPSTQGGRGTM